MKPMPNEAASPELLSAWAARKCWICQALGACAHREPLVDMALIEAFAKRRLFQENRLAALRQMGRKGFAA